MGMGREYILEFILWYSNWPKKIRETFFLSRNQKFRKAKMFIYIISIIFYDFLIMNQRITENYFRFSELLIYEKKNSRTILGYKSTKKQIPKSIVKKIIQESCTKIGTILHQTQLLKLFFDSHCIDIFFNSCDFFYLFFVGLKWKRSFGKFLILKFIFIVLFTSGWGVENE